MAYGKKKATERNGGRERETWGKEHPNSPVLWAQVPGLNVGVQYVACRGQQGTSLAEVVQNLPGELLAWSHLLQCSRPVHSFWAQAAWRRDCLPGSGPRVDRSECFQSWTAEKGQGRRGA